MRLTVKLGIGFTAVLVITLAVSAAAVWSIRRLADVNTTLYDRALMSTAYAQSALASFRKLQQLASTPGASAESLKAADEAFRDDLDVVRARTLTAEGGRLVDSAKTRYETWRTRLTPGGTIRADDVAPIESALTALTEDAAAAGFAFRESARELGQRSLLWLSILASAAVVFAIAAAVLLGRTIVRPLRRLSRQVDEIATGDLTQRVAVQSRDEVGQLGTAVNAMTDALHDGLAELARVAADAAALSRRLSNTSDALATGAQQQAAALEESAASLEEMTATVRQSADHAHAARGVSEKTLGTANEGQRVALTAVEAMQEIARAAAHITEITGTVDALAFQTNLLALNAAVEAARAGDQGRGFAVVAAEVRTLAQRSASAAREIKELIGDAVAKVGAGNEYVGRTRQELDAIAASTTEVSHLIAEMATASHEHAQGIEQVNRAVAQMDHVTQRNAAQTEDLSAAAKQLAGQAENVRALLERYRLRGTADLAREAAAPVVAPARPRAAVEPRAPALALR